ncbi:hypothetical protein N7461_000396 [Penicillium sp. DV-2018c]|nr:hypothetical protein N7461_000396 [Penicillium sp. DV-2018c]
MNSKEKEAWQQTMQVQIDKLKAANAYELAPMPPRGSTILPGKWVYDLKVDKDNVVKEFRARWVICGNRQRPGLDFDDNYAPVARSETMRLFLSMVVIKQMTIEHIDYTAAYLNAIIDNRVIWMRQPKSEKNVADALTKPLPLPTFEIMRGRMMSKVSGHHRLLAGNEDS